MSQQLLAPAGHLESFFAALENGADAIYLGLKQLSARASATNFRLDELASLIPYARQRQVAIHVALNSAVTAQEVPALLDLLQALADLQVDALIIQDPALLFLVRHHFPQLKLHASTLMTIHNSSGVHTLERLGVQRAVLARELTVAEISEIASRTRIELEIFVHGALCYSYSGLCLASSFRGGHSGLQGRCVQPCRLKFRQGRKEGFFLSCNDLCALPLLPELKRLRLAAFKIEGRMKPADYIARVVKCYRMVLDASPREEAAAVAQAQEWLAQSPSRRLTTGFLLENASRDVLSPHRSGSSGLWLGTVKSVEGERISLALRHALHSGDRLRPESKEGKEKGGFTVTDLYSSEGNKLSHGRAGEVVTVLVRKPAVKAGERLFKVAGRARSTGNPRERIHKAVGSAVRYRKSCPDKARIMGQWSEAAGDPQHKQEQLILKIGRVQDLPAAMQSPAEWVILTASRANLERVARQRVLPAHKRRLLWSLPPLLTDRELDYYRPAIDWYCDKGFRKWELNNWGHFDLFTRQQRPPLLIAGYRFNVRNQAALAALAEAGCQRTVLSVEITRIELQHLARLALPSQPVVTVYAWPPLFTSRLLPGLLEEKPFVTPRQERYFYRSIAGHSSIYAEQPMNWFEQLPVLRAQGYRAFLIDVSEGPREQSRNLQRIIGGFRRLRAEPPFSLFNFERLPIPKSTSKNALQISAGPLPATADPAGKKPPLPGGTRA